MKNFKHTALYRASRLLSEAFDLDDPMNTIDDTSFNVPSVESDPVVGDAEEVGTETAYDVDVANPVCPCCGVRLNIVDTEDNGVEDNDIEAMDPSLETKPTGYDNNDAYVSLDSLGDFDEEETEEGSEENQPADKNDDDDEEESGEKVEAF